MASVTRAQQREDHAKQRPLRKYRARLQQAHARAQRFLHAREPALVDWGLPETLAAEVEWRLKAPAKLLGQIFGVLFPPRCGCGTADALTQGRVWEKHRSGRSLGALPQEKWLRQWPRRGQDLLATLGHQGADQRPATRSRWQGTGAADDSVFKKSGQQLGLVGTWSSGPEHRVRLGIEGRLLVVVVGDGKRVVPVDFVIRRPHPVGPGHPSRDQLTWLRGMRDRTWTVLPRRCQARPVPWVGADRWWGDAALLAHVRPSQPGALVVAGKRRYVVSLPDGRRVTGADLRTRLDWPWRDSPQAPGLR